jgi:hypothetical protein
LKVKPSQKSSTSPPAAAAPAKDSKVKKEEMIAVSLPDLNTESQFDKAVGNIIEPIKRDRSTRAEMFVKNN